MVQHNNEHLTIAQLSAYADKELASKELAACDAHLQACQTCRETLADLRLTSALLHGMPQVEVPRSFVLPADLTAWPVKSAQRVRPVQASRSRSILRSSLRALSTLAAVVGFIFILAGAIAALPHGGGVTNSASGRFGVSSQVGPAPTGTILGAHEQATKRAAPTGAPTNGKRASTPTPTSTPVTSAQLSAGPGQQSPPSQPAVDLGQPSGRLEVGSACLALGILGLFASRLFRAR